MRLKVDGLTFRGSNSVIFVFASLLKKGLLFKERICSSLSKFFPFRVNSILGGLCQLRKLTQEVTKVVSRSKTVDKHGGVPMHLKC